MIKKPLLLSSRRVSRTYMGGKLLDEWKGTPDPKDCYTPEEWVASVVTSFNPNLRNGNTEGLSFFTDGEKPVSLKAYVEADPEGVLGAEHVRKFGPVTGMLTKVLDSSERLIIQVHPDKKAAKKLFKSDYGKTEAWYVMGGRKIDGENPYVLFGFKPGITEEKWRRLFAEQDIGGMEEALHRFEVKPGEVMLIEGGMPHAIGPGCLILEIQEPTDITLRTEKKSPSGLAIPDVLCHQGLGFDKMFECFHYKGYKEEEIRAKWQLAPEVLSESEGAETARLIGEKNTRCFGLERIRVSGGTVLPSLPAYHALVVMRGRAELANGAERLTIKQGDQLFVPAECGPLDVKKLPGAGDDLELVRCLPPS